MACFQQQSFPYLGEMELENKLSQEDQRWVTLKSFRFEAEAAVLAARLESVQIPVFISNSIIATTIPMAADSVKLQVPAPAIEHAQAILHQFNEDLIQNKETNFREASQDDIAYQKELSEGRLRTTHWVMALVIGVIIILLLRAAGMNSEIIPNILDPF